MNTTKYDFRKFPIISTNCDNLLFFCSDYQNKVNEALNRAMNDFKAICPDESENKHSLPTIICHEDFISIQYGRINLNENLSVYDSTLDLDCFSF